MKELSIEEKAKAYDDAIDKIKYVMEHGVSPTLNKEDLQDIFPELKSEDEKIRKALVEMVHDTTGDELWVDYNVHKEEALAWLEKQGEHKSAEFNDTNAKRMFVKALERVEEQNNKGYKLTDCDKNSWWEDFKVYTTSDQILANSAKTCKDEQKPVDKVEPKFKVGDWLIRNDIVGVACCIAQIHEPYYYLTNDHTFISFWEEDKYRLWTIQDAKDGDVLFTSSTASHETFIFKSIDEKGNAKCYFAYDSEDGFREGKYHFIGRATNCKPATKEQRNTLMKAMADAGYTFDFEKKELLKIEQNSAWSEEDENAIQVLKDIVKHSNEIDEKIYTMPLKEKLYDWLKNLRPQKQWKPSEEQMKALEHFARSVGESGYASPYDQQTKLLYSLLEQLKAQKGDWTYYKAQASIAAMQSIISNADLFCRIEEVVNHEGVYDAIASDAVKMGNALIEEIKKHRRGNRI